MIGEQHVGLAIRCFACSKVFRLQVPGATPASVPVADENEALMPTFDVDPAPAPAPSAMVLDIAAATTAGRVRDVNEDAFLVRRHSWHRLGARQELSLLVVADGMGGYGGGEKASALTVQAIQTAFNGYFDALLSGQPWSEQTASNALRAALGEASKAVHAAAAADAQLKGMGAAAIAALVCDQRVILGHVGDCRAYHFHHGKLAQLTKDQTLVQRMVDLGTLAPREALNHPAKNELSQAIGRRPDVECEIRTVLLSRGDWLVLACDGLHAHLGPAELTKEIEGTLPLAKFLTERLIEVVNQRGGSDNCTVVALQCHYY